MNTTFTGAGLQPEPLFVESLLTLKEPQIASTQISGRAAGEGPRHHRRRPRRSHRRHLRDARRAWTASSSRKSNLGGQVAITPVVENYPGFMRIGGKSLVDLIAQQAAQYSEVHVGEYVTEVDPRRGGRPDPPQDEPRHLHRPGRSLHRHGRGQPRARRAGRPEVLRQGRELLRHLRRVLLQGRQEGDRRRRREHGSDRRALSPQPRREGDAGPSAGHASGPRRGSRKA